MAHLSTPMYLCVGLSSAWAPVASTTAASASQADALETRIMLHLSSSTHPLGPVSSNSASSSCVALHHMRPVRRQSCFDDPGQALDADSDASRCAVREAQPHRVASSTLRVEARTGNEGHLLLESLLENLAGVQFRRQAHPDEQPTLGARPAYP